MAVVDDLRERSIRTLAWLGDARFEVEVRRRLAARGDYPTDRLDVMKAGVVRADAQAQLLASIEGELEPAELDVAARARNAALPASARGKRNTRAYREATAFEALVAWWDLGPPPARTRFDALVGPRLDAAIDAAIARDAARPRRG
jgi:ribonuclease III family protein